MSLEKIESSSSRQSDKEELLVEVKDEKKSSQVTLLKSTLFHDQIQDRGGAKAPGALPVKQLPGHILAVVVTLVDTATNHNPMIEVPVEARDAAGLALPASAAAFMLEELFRSVSLPKLCSGGALALYIGSAEGFCDEHFTVAAFETGLPYEVAEIGSMRYNPDPARGARWWEVVRGLHTVFGLGFKFEKWVRTAPVLSFIRQLQTVLEALVSLQPFVETETTMTVAQIMDVILTERRVQLAWLKVDVKMLDVYLKHLIQPGLQHLWLSCSNASTRVESLRRASASLGTLGVMLDLGAYYLPLVGEVGALINLAINTDGTPALAALNPRGLEHCTRCRRSREAIASGSPRAIATTIIELMGFQEENLGVDPCGNYRLDPVNLDKNLTEPQRSVLRVSLSVLSGAKKTSHVEE